ncbi:MAG: UDP-2,3-diacylglucosamine diphosphatase [Chitinophagales bacterium]|nr:UDP-2,3-diacylglucosamine diphosphatase [Chitinophagales bacterium]
MESKRHVEVCIISDIHLGTYGSCATELNRYLRSIDPGMLIINGDWLDIWNFGSNYWKSEHTENLSIIFDFLKNGIPVYYIPGNHDDIARRFLDIKLDIFELRNELFLELDGKTHWIFHGDIFDLSVSNNARWLAKLGGKSYDYLIRLNRWINFIRFKLGYDRIMLSKSIKDSIKSFVKKKVADFEELAIEHAIEHGYDYVICGHIHKPQIRHIETEKGSVTYLNSGDWIENLTALEYNKGEWTLFNYYNDLAYQGIDRE